MTELHNYLCGECGYEGKVTILEMTIHWRLHQEQHAQTEDPHG